jgi:hypothetical protein
MTGVVAAVPVAWIVARAAGLVAFGLLTLSVWLGLVMSTRILGPRRQKTLFGWHRTLVWTGLSMLGLHLGAVLLDPVLHFGLASGLVPFAATWRPAAIAAGVVAGWLHRCWPSRFGYGNGSASEAGGDCTTPALRPSGSRSHTRSWPEPTSSESADRSWLRSPSARFSG